LRIAASGPLNRQCDRDRNKQKIPQCRKTSARRCYQIIDFYWFFLLIIICLLGKLLVILSLKHPIMTFFNLGKWKMLSWTTINSFVCLKIPKFGQILSIKPIFRHFLNLKTENFDRIIKKSNFRHKNIKLLTFFLLGKLENVELNVHKSIFCLKNIGIWSNIVH